MICGFLILVYQTAASAVEKVVVPVNPFEIPELIYDQTTEPLACVHFTGDWQGQCESTEGKKDLRLKIEQPDCESTIINGKRLPIDGMENNSTNQGLLMINQGTTLAWDKERSKIIGNVQSLGQLLGKKQIVKFHYKNKFTLEKTNKYLLVNTEGQVDTYINDTKKVDKNETLCRLEIKPDLSAQDNKKILAIDKSESDEKNENYRTVSQ